MSKNNLSVRLAIIALICLLMPMDLLFSIEIYEEKKVARIAIEYDSLQTAGSFDPKPVLLRLKTKEGDEFSQFIFDDDLKALSDEYDRVQPDMQIKNGELYITIQISPRPIIHQVEFSGNERYSTSALQGELDVKPYTAFNRQEFNKSFNKLKDFYLKKGYFESQLSYSLRPIANTNEVDVVIDVKEGKSGNIQKIVFHGFSKAEQDDLGSAIYLKKYNFFTSWLTGAGKFRDDALEQDRMTILNYLHNRGYADASVNIEVLEDSITGRLIINITADRGVLYHCGCICIEGNALFTREELMKRSLIQENEIYAPDKIRDTAQAIKDLYGQKGYIDASVQYETLLHETEPVFDIQFSVDEGHQYKIGMIHIIGNHSTKNNVILRESLLVPGETFDSRKLKATQQRLEAIGYFKSVNIYAVRVEDDLQTSENYRDVYIEVEEASTGSVSLFIGFSSLDNVNGGVDLTERNFNIAGIGKCFHGKISALRGGGQYFHMRGSLGKNESNALLSWMNPYLNDTLWRLGVELSLTYSDLQSKNSKVHTYGGSVYTNYPLSVYWTAGVRQRLRHTENKMTLHQPPGTILNGQMFVTDPDKESEFQEAKEKNTSRGLLSAFSGNLAYDSTDSATKPHRGWRSYLEGEIAGLGGRFHFFKTSYLNSIYFPATLHSAFKIRGDVRFIIPYGKRGERKNVPYSERFFVGGEGTVRGYKPYILGDKIEFAYYTKQSDSTYKECKKTTETPLGGLSSCLLSAEYNYEVLRMFDVFFFFDAGSVTFKTWTIPTLRCSAGGGVRLEINSGTPIVLGYGYPINPENSFERQPFFFSMGGQF
jgi:outer membrane protein insertion porin family